MERTNKCAVRPSLSPSPAQASTGAALPQISGTIAAIITGVDDGKGKDPNDLVLEGAYLPSITDADLGLPIEHPCGAYPPGFAKWPLAKRNAWFAEEAKRYR